VYLPIWFDELLGKVDAARPDFVALHCQEVGGKSQSAVQPREVDEFVDKLTARLRERAYDRSLCVVDTDARNDQRYTALGNLYFVRKYEAATDTDANADSSKHETTTNGKYEAATWNFYERRFEPLRANVAHAFSGCVDEVAYAQKERFTPDLYPLVSTPDRYLVVSSPVRCLLVCK
jgi:hypothetical protein